MASVAIASDYLENEMYDHVLRNAAYASPANVYIALYDVDPGDDGLSGTEHAGGGYLRRVVAFSAPTNGVGSNTGKITFPTASADWGSTAGWALYDALAAGNMLFHGTLEDSKYISDGQTPEIEIGDLEISFT